MNGQAMHLQADSLHPMRFCDEKPNFRQFICGQIMTKRHFRQKIATKKVWEPLLATIDESWFKDINSQPDEGLVKKTEERLNCVSAKLVKTKTIPRQVN
jgi:hypothetical protein